jgi:hypothetical protein
MPLRVRESEASDSIEGHHLCVIIARSTFWMAVRSAAGSSPFAIMWGTFSLSAT